MSQSADVLLTYAWCRSSYSALRGLAAHGRRVVVADSGRIGMCQASRLPLARACYRSPHDDPAGFVDDVVALCQRYRVGVLLAGHEEVELLAEAREQGRLPDYTALPSASVACLALANDKQRMTQLAIDCGVPVAPVLEWQHPAQAGVASDPRRRYVVRARRGNSSKGVSYSQGGEALVAELAAVQQRFQLDEARRPLVQQWVPGNGWGVSCLYWRGQRVAHFTHRRLQEKIQTGGTSTLRGSQHHPQLEAFAHRLLTALDWHGLAMLEFKVDAASGEAVFIEMNPRLWGSLELARLAGVDFPELLCVAQQRGIAAARARFRPGRQGVVVRWWLGDMIRRIDLLQRREWRAALALGGHPTIHGYDDLKLDDPLVVAGEALYYLTKALRRGSLNPIEAGMVR